MRKRNIHTTYNNDTSRWNTRVEGKSNPEKTAATKEKAMQNSMTEAKQRKVEHIIHNRDGKISDSDSYGNDPHPPKDKEY